MSSLHLCVICHVHSCYILCACYHRGRRVNLAAGERGAGRGRSGQRDLCATLTAGPWSVRHADGGDCSNLCGSPPAHEVRCFAAGRPTPWGSWPRWCMEGCFGVAGHDGQPACPAQVGLSYIVEPDEFDVSYKPLVNQVDFDLSYNTSLNQNDLMQHWKSHAGHARSACMPCSARAVLQALLHEVSQCSI